MMMADRLAMDTSSLSGDYYPASISSSIRWDNQFGLYMSPPWESGSSFGNVGSLWVKITRC